MQHRNICVFLYLELFTFIMNMLISFTAIMTVTYGQHFETYLSQAGSSVTTLAIEAIKLNQSTFDLNAHPIQMATGLGLKCWKEYEAYTLNNLTIGQHIFTYIYILHEIIQLRGNTRSPL